MGNWEQWLLTVPVGVIYSVALLLPFLESAVFVGLVVPGETGLLVAGAVAGLGHADPFAVAACGIVGAVAGDSVGFLVGRRLGPRLTTGRMGRLIGSARWERAEGFVGRYGGHAVFLGRWVGFARALVPALAGAGGLGYRRFLVWNALGGAVWATSVTLIGYLAGNSWQHVERIFGAAVILVLLAGAVVLFSVVLAKWIARHPDRVRRWAERQAGRPSVRAVLARYDRQVRWLGRRFEPHTVLGLQLTAGIAFIVAGGWFFGAVLQDVIVGEEAVRVDRPILDWLVTHRDAALTSIVVPLHGLTGVWGSLGVAVVGALLTRARRRDLVLALAAWGGAAGSALLVAALVRRVGPPSASALVAPTTGGSFPALEIATTTAVAGVLACLASGRARSWVRAVTCWTVAALWAGAAGAVAAYLGAVWATDVLGGWALGALWCATLVTSTTQWEHLSAAARTN
ncbi:VTT domain-containing protein [Nocardiopsis sp. NPDC058789]|uniref:VTT domain-containing protein n=1 Tax=Nocardiopsis sp. NPDC058789 TaxID=3346634 RepID=UPI00366DDDE6